MNMRVHIIAYMCMYIWISFFIYICTELYRCGCLSLRCSSFVYSRRFFLASPLSAGDSATVKVMYSPKALTEQHREHCVGQARYWTAHTKMHDRTGWKAADYHFCQEPHIWQYIQYGLSQVLTSTRSPGQAAWSWRGGGAFYLGYIWSNGTSQGLSLIHIWRCRRRG